MKYKVSLTVNRSDISSRFLQMLAVCDRVVQLSDALTVYYYSFLSEEEKVSHRYGNDSLTNTFYSKHS